MSSFKVIMGVSQVKRLYDDLCDKLKNNSITTEELDFYKKIIDAKHYLEQGYGIDKDKQVPARFLSKRREHLDKLSRRLTNLLNSDKLIKVHHWHLEREGKYRELFWALIPDTNLILITHIAEVHPREYNNLNLSVLPFKKNSIEDTKKDNVELNFNYSDYPKTLQFNCLGKLTRVSINEYRIGAVYKNDKDYYFFLKIRNFRYVYFKLTNYGLKKLFKYKFDSKSYNENPMKLTLIKDILKMNSNQLKLLVLTDNQENISSISYKEVLSLLNQQEIDDIRYKSVDESLELIILLEDLWLEEMTEIIKGLDV